MRKREVGFLGLNGHGDQAKEFFQGVGSNLELLGNGLTADGQDGRRSKE